MIKDTTTATVTLKGVAYIVVKERQMASSNEKSTYLSIDRAVNQSLNELYELKAMIKCGQLVYV